MDKIIIFFHLFIYFFIVLNVSVIPLPIIIFIILGIYFLRSFSPNCMYRLQSSWSFFIPFFFLRRYFIITFFFGWLRIWAVFKNDTLTFYRDMLRHYSFRTLVQRYSFVVTLIHSIIVNANYPFSYKNNWCLS